MIAHEDFTALRRGAEERPPPGRGAAGAPGPGPAEALAMFTACGGDGAAAIVDVLMPRRLGCVLARELGALRPALPVLLLSAQPAADRAREGRLDPAAPLLSRPFDAEALSAALQRLLDAPAP